MLSDDHGEFSSYAHGEDRRLSIKICRGCLSVDGLTPPNYSLSQAFTQVTGILPAPRFLCVQCKAILTKCLTFRERARRVNDVLTELLRSNDLNLTNINKIKRKKLRIKPLLEPRHYPPNHCDWYHDGDNVENDKNNSTAIENAFATDIIFTVGIPNQRTEDESPKSPKKEVDGDINESDNLHEEYNMCLVADAEPVTPITPAKHRRVPKSIKIIPRPIGSGGTNNIKIGIPRLCHYNTSTIGQTTRIRRVPMKKTRPEIYTECLLISKVARRPVNKNRTTDLGHLCEFTCCKCNFIFQSQDILMRHILKCDGRKDISSYIIMKNCDRKE